jgi:FAD/FMN-containing dehydrogenase
MGDLQATTLTGQETTLPAAAIAAFQQSLRGPLIAPDDARYAEARQVWNANIDRRPGLICRPVGVADVRSAVCFARDHHLLVSVRGGAHSFPGTCVCNGGLGYRYGLASDNLISVDTVTADGTVRVASDTEHPDLFWAVRGGWGNFGVVTSFAYRLHPVGPVLAGPVFHPFTKAKEVLQFCRDFASATDEQLTTYAAPMSAPDGAKVIAIAVCYSGPLDEGERLVVPVRIPPRIQQAHFLREISDAIDTVVKHFASIPSPLSLLSFTLALTLSHLRRLRLRQDGRIGVYTLSGTQAERR